MPNQEIFRRLARAMGFNEPELFEDDPTMLDQLCAQAGIEGGFAALKSRGTVEHFAQPVLQFADGNLRTPNGEMTPPQPDPTRVIRATTAATMRSMLEGVVLGGTGTKAKRDGYTAAGKTGTAQKIYPATGRYSTTGEGMRKVN